MRALKHVWVSLEPLHAPMAVMGGLALAAWRHVRATRDVDLLIGVSEEDLEPLLRTLTSAGLRPKHQPPWMSVSSPQILQLLYEPPRAYLELQVDLLLAQSEYHRQALARRIPTRLAALDLDLYVLACEDLIPHKLLAGRLLDRADAAMLFRTNRADLNLEYLLSWTTTLSLGAELAMVWEEAFLGEVMSEMGGNRQPGARSWTRPGLVRSWARPRWPRCRRSTLIRGFGDPAPNAEV